MPDQEFYQIYFSRVSSVTIFSGNSQKENCGNERRFYAREEVAASLTEKFR